MYDLVVWLGTPSRCKELGKRRIFRRHREDSEGEVHLLYMLPRNATVTRATAVAVHRRLASGVYDIKYVSHIAFMAALAITIWAGR